MQVLIKENGCEGALKTKRSFENVAKYPLYYMYYSFILLLIESALKSSDRTRSLRKMN